MRQIFFFSWLPLSSHNTLGKFACPGSVVICGKRLICKQWVDKCQSSWRFWGSYRLLFTCLLFWRMYDILASSREWEGERHLEGGISELSILPAAQQVKVTLHFVYFPPISICEQNGKERKSQHENKKWWKMMREQTIISSPLFPSL